MITTAFANLNNTLAGLAVNTKDTPYDLEITGLVASDIGNSNTAGTLGNILASHSTKYFSLEPTTLPSVTNMISCFYNCTSLTTAPVIGNGVINMALCFDSCTSLTTAPVIGNSVTNMYGCFYNCTSLTTAPVIGNSVTDMTLCFYRCTSLTTIQDWQILSPSTVNMTDCFAGCTALANIYIKIPITESEWRFLSINTTGTTATVTAHNQDGTLQSTADVTVAPTDVITLSGKIDELVIDDTAVMTPAIIAQAVQYKMPFHIGALLPDKKHLLVYADDPSAVMSNCFYVKGDPVGDADLTGTPTAPTPATATNNTQIATTAFVKNQGYVLASPSISGSCTTSGTTNNTLVLTGIVPALALEIGDVIQITGSTGGLNDKLFTVESSTDDNNIIVNYEHAGNRGNGSLKLADQTATVTIKRIAKWYNAPIGLGRGIVDVKPSRNIGTLYTNETNREIEILVITETNLVGALLGLNVQGYDLRHKETNYEGNFEAIVPREAEYKLYSENAKGNSTTRWKELR